MNIEHRKCLKGDAPICAPVLGRIIKSFPELTWSRSYTDAYDQLIESTSSLDLWDEFFVKDQSGNLLAFAIATDDDDAHVGPCMSIQWCVAFPEAPSRAMIGIHRALRKHAARCGYGVMAYTHRLGEGRYEINYVKV